MANKDKSLCCECNKVCTADNLCCITYRVFCHPKCGGITEDLFKKIAKISNFIWSHSNCLSVSTSNLEYARSFGDIKEKQEAMDAKLTVLQEGYNKLLETIKVMNVSIKNTETNSDGLVTECDITKYHRLKSSGDRRRPVLIKFNDRSKKNLIMENLCKIKYLETELTKIGVSHDLNKEHGEERKKLVEEAKEKQKNNQNNNKE
ncbi:hypothetical protein HELRODRAFT_165068 [Helobdella robusta]|uniref:Uncharacterized protein n=1 Tax=Helobdella robusta TaxID=6412 RepID=T1EW88_HELRO|nr:hypothetical protein HELRODRAFT_165068 [Helobdella robusta]ESN92931.1 hypothetical protein HELRODRAFT_165068 [Helobdella robusta]